ncbi:MAG: hypothetical protein ACSLFI_09720 [Solirubrobacterales bacterium]
MRKGFLLGLIGIGVSGAVLLGCGDPERPKSDEQIAAERVEKATGSLDETAAAAGAGLLIYNAKTQLTVLGLSDRYGVRAVKGAGGNLAIITKVPSEPKPKARAAAAKICDALIGGDPPVLDLPGKIGVISGDRKLIRAPECRT